MTTTMYESGAYLEQNPDWHEADSPWKAGQIEKMLRRNEVVPDTVCEVGCGVGGILQNLSMSMPQARYTGYEVSPQAHEISLEKEKSNLNFVLEDLTQVDDAFFDLLLCIDVFEHVDDYYGFLSQIREKADYKLFHIPLDLCVQNVLRGHPLQQRRDALGHIHYFSKQTALASLEHSGYSILDAFYTQPSWSVPCKGWKSRLAKVPRKLLFTVNEELGARLLGGFSLMVLAR